MSVYPRTLFYDYLYSVIIISTLSVSISFLMIFCRIIRYRFIILLSIHYGVMVTSISLRSVRVFRPFVTPLVNPAHPQDQYTRQIDIYVFLPPGYKTVVNTVTVCVVNKDISYVLIVQSKIHIIVNLVIKRFRVSTPISIKTQIKVKSKLNLPFHG